MMNQYRNLFGNKHDLDEPDDYETKENLTRTKTCLYCNGRGTIISRNIGDPHFAEEIETCPHCLGRG